MRIGFLWACVCLCGAMGLPHEGRSAPATRPTTGSLLEQAMAWRLGAAQEPVLAPLRSQTTDSLMLLNGDKLSGTVVNPTLTVRTAYAKLTLAAQSLAAIQFDGAEHGLDLVLSVAGDRIYGFIDEPSLQFKLPGGEVVEIRKEKLQQALYRVRPTERTPRPPKQLVMLRSGDQLSCSIVADPLVVVTGYGEMPLKLSDLDAITPGNERSAMLKFALLNGDLVRGTLKQEEIEIELDLGPRIGIHPSRLDVIYFRPDQPRAERTTLPTTGPTSAPAPVRREFANSLGMRFIEIHAGDFTMGSPDTEPGREPDETPHAVRITRAFMMGAHEVTQGQWKAIMGTTLAQQRDKANKALMLRGEGEKHPMYFVSWQEATEFCRLLSQKDGRVYRLPTEAEWEYACRAGTTTPFNTGKSLTPQQANCGFRSAGTSDAPARSETMAVGSFPPNAWGILDMHGNVWEWCSDWYGDYPREKAVDPRGPEQGGARVLRGGSWLFDAPGCRSANRSWASPDLRENFIGLRVVLENVEGSEILAGDATGRGPNPAGP